MHLWSFALNKALEKLTCISKVLFDILGYISTIFLYVTVNGKSNSAVCCWVRKGKLCPMSSLFIYDPPSDYSCYLLGKWTRATAEHPGGDIMNMKDTTGKNPISLPERENGKLILSPR